MLKKIGLTIVILFIGFLMSLILISKKSQPKTLTNYSYVSTPVSSPTTLPFSTDKLWTLIQNWRQSQDLAPYTVDKRLCDIATDRLSDGLDDHKNFYSKVTAHNQFPYTEIPSGIILQENQLGLIYLPTNQGALNAWLNSPPHLATLKKPYKFSCLACGNKVCDQEFSNL